MKLYELHENIDLKAFLKKNCLQACKDALKAKTFLFRGMNIGEETTYQVKNSDGTNSYLNGTVKVPRNQREPKDTPKWAHDEFNAFFKKKFGIPLRSDSLFCAVTATHAASYGALHAILPIGSYDVYWSPQVEDLTTYIFPDLESGESTGHVGGHDAWDEKPTRDQEVAALKDLLADVDYKKGA